MTYKDKVYDREKKYLGGEGHWSTEYLREAMGIILCPILIDDFDVDAFPHDVDYSGERRTGFFGRILDFIERSNADIRFWDRMKWSVDIRLERDEISKAEALAGYAFAKLAYKAVRLGGRGNFKINKGI